ncbi:UDP-glycosyltransferase UGT5 [Leptinotarsa decemlineata]|uniref:UDP-glycosyltransferase UGT5 n=1 Tax=Leptinotarsa decemlineata TaxID=7539 RepID=UPI003D30C161
MKILYIIIILLEAVYLGNSLNILVVFSMPARSHFILGNSLARGLVEAGHDVTIVSPFEDKNPPKDGKYTSVKLEGMKETMESIDQNVNMFDLFDMNPFIFIPFMNFMGNVITNATLTNANFKKLVNSDQKFDVVVIEQFNNDALRVLACHYQAPLVMFSSVGASSWVNSLVGNPSPPSYIPDMFLSYTRNMNIWQRSVNVLMYLSKELSHRFFFTPAQNELARKHFPKCVDENGPITDVSLLLLNSHESVDDPVPYVPNMVNIGGYHVNPPKSLPKDLQEFCDNAKDGVIYFSMGSNLKPSDMSQDSKQAILSALGKLKQKVLWKWDEDHLPGKPENVKIGKWFPQQDILAHPNVKLFITHGGLLSKTETIYHGVPILAIPVFGDQKMNSAKAVAAGYGLSLSIKELNEEKLSNILNELLHNSKYRDNAKRRSAIMHDRKVKPMDLATYWIEFVVRHKGAPHLRVAALDLTWYQYFLVDIVLLVGAVVASLMLASYLLLKNLCCPRKTSEKIKKN